MVKNRFLFLLVYASIILTYSCHFPAYRSVAETSLYDLNLSQGKWFLNYVAVNGKPVNAFSDFTENELKPCLSNSLYLSYGRKNSIYKVPILTSKNSTENLSLLKVSKLIDYVIQVTGYVGNNEVTSFDFKPMTNTTRTNAVMKVEVFDVNSGQIIYSHYTSGEVIIENLDEDILFGKSAQSILKNCLQKELKMFKKNSGCH